MADRLRCVVKRITYQNPDNGYSVITEEYDVHRDNKGEEGTCAGRIEKGGVGVCKQYEDGKQIYPAGPTSEGSDTLKRAQTPFWKNTGLQNQHLRIG